jgi:hypothetical protein
MSSYDMMPERPLVPSGITPSPAGAPPVGVNTVLNPPPTVANSAVVFPASTSVNATPPLLNTGAVSLSRVGEVNPMVNPPAGSVSGVPAPALPQTVTGMVRQVTQQVGEMQAQMAQRMTALYQQLMNPLFMLSHSGVGNLLNSIFGNDRRITNAGRPMKRMSASWKKLILHLWKQSAASPRSV